MAKKHREVKGEAPPSSDEADSDDSDSSASSEEPILLAGDRLGNNKSDEDSESESEDSPVKRVASKSMDDASKLKKPRSKSNSKSGVVIASATTSPMKMPASKRLVEVESDTSRLSKKLKKEKGDEADSGVIEKEAAKKGAGGEEEKKQLFQRLWSDDDEIAILKGMLDYAQNKGSDPMSDVNKFHGFIKESLHVDVDRKQLADKVRRLKKRYENSMGKKKTFNPHEKKAFDLSYKIWGYDKVSDVDQGNSSMKTRTVSKAAKSAASSGGNGVLVGSSLKNGEVFLAAHNGGKVGKTDEAGKRAKDWGVYLEGGMGKRCVLMGMDENVVNAGLSLVGEEKRAEMEEKWRELALAESELFLKKVELLQQSSKLIMEALLSGSK